MKKLLLMAALVLPVYAFADNHDEKLITNTEGMEGGLLTSKLGAKLKGYVSAPVFGAYIIGKYTYSSDESLSGKNNSFSARMIRAYVSGYILKDFKYRLQAELSGTPHMRDYTLEWQHWSELNIKAGQFKRCFTFENPYNPWDVGFSDYSQVTKMLAGMSTTPSGQAGDGGRDLGIQLSGDLFRIGKDKHSLLRYMAGIYNGNGINKADNNSQKDFIGSIQFQPVKGLFLGVFGWTGSYTGDNKVRVSRNLWATGMDYKFGDWAIRGEYAHHSGWNVNDTNHSKMHGADGWYAAVGVPCTPWLKVWAKYDVYRNDATWASSKTMYCLAPNFQIHKDLKLQLQYNYVHDKTTADRNYHELWCEFYVRM